MSKILLIDSSDRADPALKKIISCLEEKGEAFFCLSKTGGWGGKKVFFGPEPVGFFSSLIFFTCLPFLRFFFFFRLLFLKKKRKIGTVVLKGDREKMIISCLCPFLKLRVVWLFVPEEDCIKKPKLISFFLKVALKNYPAVVFTEAKKSQLIATGFHSENIKNVSLGIKTADIEYQDNIFSNIARLGSSSRPKHFTVGVVADLNCRKPFEIFFRALSICAKMIPGFQVVIIGEGQEKKNLFWLVKRMELERVVCFVGEQENLQKWLEGFDIFAAIFERPNLTDLNVVLEAMLCHRPLVGFDSQDIRSLVLPQETGFLVDFSDAEVLAEKIIVLEQDSLLRNRFGERANRLAMDNYEQDRQLNKIKAIISYEDEN